MKLWQKIALGSGVVVAAVLLWQKYGPQHGKKTTGDITKPPLPKLDWMIAPDNLKNSIMAGRGPISKRDLSVSGSSVITDHGVVMRLGESDFGIMPVSLLRAANADKLPTTQHTMMAPVTEATSFNEPATNEVWLAFVFTTSREVSDKQLLAHPWFVARYNLPA
jgi:hypothetical protein